MLTVIASFRSTMNKVAPRFRVQCRKQALVAYCRRCSAILSELQFTIVTGSKGKIGARAVKKRRLSLYQTNRCDN